MLASTVAVVMAHPGAALAVARPVAAGRVLVPRESGAVEPRAGQRISCRLGASPRPFTTSPFSSIEFSFESLFWSLCKSSTSLAT